MNRELQIIGLAFRARKVVLGEDAVLDSIRSKEAKLIFLAYDAGVNTKKRILDKASYYNVEVDDTLSSESINQALGKANIKVLSIVDQGFVNSIKK